MKGIFIPQEFFQIEDLNYSEMIVLAVYKYYTEEGRYHCCSMTNEEIAKMLRMGERNLQTIKKHLKTMGFIKSDGGIKVKYVGIDRGELDCTHQVKPTVPGGEAELIPGVQNTAVRGEAERTHNKEEKTNKDFKKEGMTNFDLVIENLPREYKTQEKIDFLSNNYNDRINHFNGLSEIDDSMIECWVSQIKHLLIQQFPPTYKKETKDVIEEDPFLI